jgi:hypothetical protein
MENIALQDEFRPCIPTVLAPKDYREFRARLEEMDRILTVSGLEHAFLTHHLEACPDVPQSQWSRLFRIARKALRYNILLAITGDSLRDLSHRVADSNLSLWFTFTSQIDAAHPVSKSQIGRFCKMFPDGEVARLIHDLNNAAGAEAKAAELLRSSTEIRFDKIFADTTCVKANIHFPVDWVLLRDAVRTLVAAIKLIRRQGLKHRMPPPATFLALVNKLCMEMTQGRRKKDGDKARKRIFRRMRRLLKVVEEHGVRYRDMLDSHWEQTSWSELEKNVVLNRMDNIRRQLPQAVEQATKRLLNGESVENKDKILSLYEHDVHVLVRGKAGAEVEFGNALYLAEQEDGLIVDFLLIQGQPPADSKLVHDSLVRIQENYGKPSSYTGDRGFSSKANKELLEKLKIEDAICPRSVPEMQERLKEPAFRENQTRRASTEARISVMKNCYIGNPLRSKGFKNRGTSVCWCVLVHNLWKLSDMAVRNRQALEEPPAAAA